MKERRKKGERRKGERRRFLTEKEFRRLIEEGKVVDNEHRSWIERRKRKRRKRQF